MHTPKFRFIQHVATFSDDVEITSAISEIDNDKYVQVYFTEKEGSTVAMILSAADAALMTHNINNTLLHHKLPIKDHVDYKLIHRDRVSGEDDRKVTIAANAYHAVLDEVVKHENLPLGLETHISKTLFTMMQNMFPQLTYKELDSTLKAVEHARVNGGGQKTLWDTEHSVSSTG